MGKRRTWKLNQRRCGGKTREQAKIVTSPKTEETDEPDKTNCRRKCQEDQKQTDDSSNVLKQLQL